MTKTVLPPITIAVVGHTNAGKTSLLRTLSRDKLFGSVSGQRGKTRHVEATSVSIDGLPALRLFDTPGFEDSIALQDYLQQFTRQESRRSTIASFLKSPEASGRFEQEAKILRVLLDDIDAVFYVIDTTETPHAKFKSELDILASCARPVMPILNFIRHPESRASEWHVVLADRGLHVQATFDVVSPLAGSERSLYEQLAALLGPHRTKLDELVMALEREASARAHAGLRTVSDLLVDVGAFRTHVDKDNPEEIKVTVDNLQTKIRLREQHCADALLSIYRFDRDDLEFRESPSLSGRLDDDLFNPELLRQTAERLGKGAAIGVMVGLAADFAVAGISMGAGAVIGGAVGGMVVSTWQKASRWTKEKIAGHIDLTVEDATLSHLLCRQLQLLSALQGRAHAATARLKFDDNRQMNAAFADILAILNIVRAHPDWSRLSVDSTDNQARIEAVESIASKLKKNVL